jgi:hypothetical protein
MDNEEIIMLKGMKAYGHLKPGQKGTQRLVNRFELHWSVAVPV